MQAFKTEPVNAKGVQEEVNIPNQTFQHQTQQDCPASSTGSFTNAQPHGCQSSHTSRPRRHLSHLCYL